MVAHGFDFDRSEPAGVGHGRTRHASEDHRGDNVDVAKPAAQPSYGCDCEVENAICDAGRVHQIAGEDEERDSQQREAVDATRHPMQHHEVGDSRKKVRIEER